MATVTERVRAWILTGNSNAIRTSSTKILAAAKATRKPQDKIFLKTAAAGQFLAMIDKSAARRALNPYVTKRGAIAVHPSVKFLDTRSHARVLTQVSNLMYRHLQFNEGLELAKEANDLLESIHQQLTPLEFLIEWSENAIWRVRLDWRKARAKDVHDSLRNIVHTLEAGYTIDNTKGFGAITLNLAIALELWAAIDWFEGHITEARTKVFRSIALHGEVKDSVRAAYAYYTAGRIEYSHERSEFTWAEHLLRMAERSFETLGHPFRWRASNQRARCLLRQRNISAARKIADHMSKYAVSDPLEKAYADGERKLTLAWICETEPAWEKALAHSEALVANATALPTRLAAEGYLHRAIARTQLGDPPNEILADIAEARKMALCAESTKIHIACDLSTAELLADSHVEVHAADAVEYLQSAERQLSGVESRFLRDWLVRVASKLERYVPTRMDGKWESIRKQHARTYYIYNAHRSETVDDFLKRTGWAPSTYDKYRGLYGSHIGRAQRSRRSRKAGGRR